VNPGSRTPPESRRGALIVNADDWGSDQETTDRTWACVRNGSVSSVSAMVFMEDAERAGRLALEHGVDAGLHLNFTSPFSAAEVPTLLREHQSRTARYLRRDRRLAPVLFHPGLVRSFDYLVHTQLEEFRRVYGREPDRIDGHQHMHLAANVVLAKLLPAGVVVRRNYSFRSGEKSAANRWYRAAVDRMLARRHPMADYLFRLPPIEPLNRLERFFALASDAVVELEAHAIDPTEYRFLAGGEIFRHTAEASIRRFCDVSLVGPRRADHGVGVGRN
jgi:chitin disaccharide deacetylase